MNIRLTKYSQLVLVLLLSLLITNSCSDSDLEVPFARQTADSFFAEKGPESYNQAVIGGYAKLTQFYKHYTGVNATPPTYLQALGLMRDDLLTSNQPDPYEVFGSLNATNPSNSVYYKLAYELINRMNIALDNMALYGDDVFAVDPSLRPIYEGEARFLRAYIYFHLAMNYNSPPLLKESILSLSFIPVNSTEGEVLDFAISEFSAVASMLPNNWTDVNIGRATKGTALGMLGKALLQRGTANNYDNADLTAAIAALSQIEGLGYALTPKFNDNFNGNIENNQESLFEIQAGQNEISNNIWVPIDDFDVIADLGAYWGFFNGFFTNRLMLPSEKLLSSFEDGDPRQSATFREGQIKKYIDNDVSIFPTSLNNPRVLRYADVLLMQAEAMIMSGGNKATAIGLLNQVRERARNSSDPASAVPADRDVAETDATVILQWVMDERVMELAGEESWRWYDLIRWHKAGQINLGSMDFSSVQSGFAFDVNKHMLLPFPSSEVSLSNGSLVQNPNY